MPSWKTSHSYGPRSNSPHTAAGSCRHEAIFKQFVPSLGRNALWTHICSALDPSIYIMPKYKYLRGPSAQLIYHSFRLGPEQTLALFRTTTSSIRVRTIHSSICRGTNPALSFWRRWWWRHFATRIVHLQFTSRVLLLRLPHRSLLVGTIDAHSVEPWELISSRSRWWQTTTTKPGLQ